MDSSYPWSWPGRLHDTQRLFFNFGTQVWPCPFTAFTLPFCCPYAALTLPSRCPYAVRCVVCCAVRCAVRCLSTVLTQRLVFNFMTPDHGPYVRLDRNVRHRAALSFLDLLLPFTVVDLSLSFHCLPLSLPFP